MSVNSTCASEHNTPSSITAFATRLLAPHSMAVHSWSPSSQLVVARRDVEHRVGPDMERLSVVHDHVEAARHRWPRWRIGHEGAEDRAHVRRPAPLRLEVAVADGGVVEDHGHEPDLGQRLDVVGRVEALGLSRAFPALHGMRCR